MILAIDGVASHRNTTEEPAVEAVHYLPPVDVLIGQEPVEHVFLAGEHLSKEATGEVEFLKERESKLRREFYIPRINRERTLYGSQYEVRLRNQLTQKAIAIECADWIRKKVRFKSNTTNNILQGFINVKSDSVFTYTPVNGFTTTDLGCERGNNMMNFVNKVDGENAKQYLRVFNEIWNKLYDFQKDAALAIISKLEKYNGCILADSVGLGKTFTALSVIKYYETRNKSVLVLCPKKLCDNWMTYRNNYITNPIAADRLSYTVLFHSDLSRGGGQSNGIALDKINWGNFDLVVIDESHNFRNGGKLTWGDDDEDPRRP